MAVTILTLATYSYSNGVVGATISNGVSQSVGIFDTTTNSIGNTFSIMTYSQVINEPLLANRLTLDSQYGFEYFVQEYTLPSATHFRVTYYKWDSHLNVFNYIKNSIISRYNSNNIGEVNAFRRNVGGTGTTDPFGGYPYNDGGCGNNMNFGC